MREVRVKERKMKWGGPLISNRSSQQQKTCTRQSKKSPPTPDGEPPQQHLNHPHATMSAAFNTTSPDSKSTPIPNQINILLSSPLIGLIFCFIQAELDGINNEIFDLNSEFKLEKMVLNNDCGVSSSPTNNTIGGTYTPSFCFSPTGVGLAEFNNLGCEFNAVLAAATATVTIVTKEHTNKNIFESGALWSNNKNNNSRDNKNKNDKNGSKTKEQLMSDTEGAIMYREYRSKVHFCLIYLLKRYKKLFRSKKQYQLSIETDPEKPGLHFYLANMLAESQYKHFEDATYHFEKAIELEPFYAAYRMFYAEFLWHDMNNHSESEIQYKELLKCTKDNEDIYFDYGLLRDHVNKYELAIEQFVEALESVPNDNEAEEELEYTKNLLQDAKPKV